MKSRSFSIVLGLTLLASSVHAAPPFAGAGGNYGGILEAGSDPDNSGLLIVEMNDRGSASLKLFWQGDVYVFKSAFAADKTLTRVFGKKHAPAGTKLNLLCNLNPAGRTISGILTDNTADGGGFNLTGAKPDATVVEQLAPGLRTAFIDPTAAPSGGIAEDGFAVVTIGKTGTRSTRFAGTLPDGTPYSAGSPLRGTQYALRAGLYAQRSAQAGGQLLGLADADASGSAPSEARTTRDLGGSVAALVASFRWHKKKNTKIRTNSYPDGIDQRIDLNTRTYARNRSFAVMLTGNSLPSNATLRFTDGNLGTTASVGMNVNFLGARIVAPNPNRVKISVNPLTARFGGSFRHPDTGELIRFRGGFSSFSGVTPGEGHGAFLSLGPAPRDPANAHSGSVRIAVQ
jgi:hypothetical protein